MYTVYPLCCVSVVAGVFFFYNRITAHVQNGKLTCGWSDIDQRFRESVPQGRGKVARTA